jgi:hypothetical protein
MVHEDGDIEDLEQHELDAALEMVKTKHEHAKLDEAPFMMKPFPDVAQLSKRMRDSAKHITIFFAQKEKRHTKLSSQWVVLMNTFSRQNQTQNKKLK